MIIAELSGRCRQSAIVLGGEGQSLGTKDTLSIGNCETLSSISKFAFISTPLLSKCEFLMFKVNSMLLTLGNFTNHHALLTDGKICASKICDGNEGFECLCCY